MPEFRRQFDRQGGSSPVYEPDMVHVVDVNARDLLHAPLVRQRLGPERIDEVPGRAFGVDGLTLHNLRFGGIRHDAAQACDGRQRSALDLHDLFPRLGRRHEDYSRWC